jgi:hypothetical protein
VNLNYGDAIKLPTNNPERVKTNYFNPSDVMTFEGWYKQKECNKDDEILTNLQLTIDNFPELKTTDIIKIYAYFEPHFYYWDSDKPIKDGGQPVAYTANYLPTSIAKDQEFKKLPTGNDFKKYANAPKFLDYYYTNDQQAGVWFLKWKPESGNKGSMDYDEILNTECNVLYKDNFGEIRNGDFTQTGYSIDDFFFVPILGEYRMDNPNNELCTTKTPTDSYCWGSYIYSNTLYPIDDETVIQPIYYSHLGLYIYEVKYDPNYGTNRNQGRTIRGTGLLRYWPDPTYPGN